MTSEEQVQKFHTDDANYRAKSEAPVSAFTSDNGDQTIAKKSTNLYLTLVGNHTTLKT